MSHITLQGFPHPALGTNTEFSLEGPTEAEVIDGIKLGLLDIDGRKNIAFISSEEDLNNLTKCIDSNRLTRFKYGVAELPDNRLQLRVLPIFDCSLWHLNHRDLFLGADIFGQEEVPTCFEDRIVAAGFLSIHRSRYIIDGLSFEIPTAEQSARPKFKALVSDNPGLLRAKSLFEAIFPNRKIKVMI